MTGSGRCHGPHCERRLTPASTDAYFCGERCEARWTANQNGVLLGRQEPTFLWVPDYKSSAGQEVIDMARDAGLELDPWQQLLIRHAFAEDEFGAWLCFEIAIVVSRQNGKGSILEAVELAWLFLFGEKLVTHSAHLFETSREHFLRISALITNNDDFRRRVRKVREGRGSEEIELYGPKADRLTGGARLKFMTRKGGAGRGFTGGKVVCDEAMYLDATAMAASVPTMATDPTAQIWYTGSAGMKHSTQLAAVRRRGYQRDDPTLMYAEWAIETREADDDGNPLTPDDRTDPVVWAKVNPGFGPKPASTSHVAVGRITEGFIRKEARALGGYDSVQWGTERLGVGDWPEDDDAWEVISKLEWGNILDPVSGVREGAKVAFGLDADPDRMLGTIVVYGLRPDGKGHIETVVRHRGITWMPDWLSARGGRIVAVVLLPDGTCSPLLKPLKEAKLPVHCPTEVEYARGCGDLYTAIVERDSVRRLDQPSMSTAVGGARKRKRREGGWTWDRSAPSDQATIVGATLAKIGYERFGDVGGGFALSSDDLAGTPTQQPRTRHGATGYASALRGRT